MNRTIYEGGNAFVGDVLSRDLRKIARDSATLPGVIGCEIIRHKIKQQLVL